MKREDLVKWRKRTMRVWNALIILGGLALVFLTFSNDLFSLEQSSRISWGLSFIFLLGFYAEYVDSSLGMGYGTTLTPVLLMIGYSPMQIVPSILFSEFITGFLAGILHHRAKNAKFSSDSRGTKILLVMSICSVLGAVAAVSLALNLPKFWLKVYIGLMICGVGCFIFWGKRLVGAFSWSKVFILGIIAAFNKGISGGGYGPLVTGGQIVVGVKEKEAIAITSFAEGVVCLVALSLYLIYDGYIFWPLALPLTFGAILSAPVAVLTVKFLPRQHLRANIGCVTIFLGVLVFLRLAIKS